MNLNMKSDKKKLLVVEDAADYQLVIKSALKDDYELTFASSTEETYQVLRDDSFDLVLLDIVLPDGDGYQICSKLRGQDSTKNTPIIFVTSKETVPDKVMGFSLGGDDYVTKPFNPLELKARVAAKIRSHISSQQLSDVIQRGDIELQVSSQRVYLQKGQEKALIDLTSTEFKILLYMLNHVDHVLSRDQILENVWGGNLNVTERTIDTHVSKLRKKLDFCGHCIESVHGSGYRFVVKNSNSYVA